MNYKRFCGSDKRFRMFLRHLFLILTGSTQKRKSVSSDNIRLVAARFTSWVIIRMNNNIRPFRGLFQMRKCQNCGFQSNEVIHFCRKCGSPIKSEPRMVVPLGDLTKENWADEETQSLAGEAEIGYRVQPSVPTITVKKPQSKKVFFAVFGVLTFLVISVLGVAGLLYYYSSKSRTIQANSVSKPKTEKKTVAVTPSVSPSKLPEQSPVDPAEQIFDSPTKPTRKGSFRVEANSGKWQLSEIETVGSETFRAIARGTIVLKEVRSNVSPSGIESDIKRRIYKEFPTGALLMRTRFASGKTSVIQSVSASDIWENDKEESGRLEFLINDKSPGKNSGSFVVSVSMVKVP